MNWHLVGDELERICRNELLQRWPECEIIETKYDSVHGIDFAVRLRNGGIAIVEVKSAFGSVHGQQMTASWIADRLSPLLESAIINAFSWGAPVFRATYRVFAEKGVIRSATPTGSLTWAELFPNKPHPIKATDFSFSHGQAFIDGTYIKITHYYKNNITKQNHEYMINLEILSKAFVDSTLEFKTFPFELPHSHRIVENGVETYFRPLHQWISHLDSKLGLLDSKVGRETCRKCRITFFDNSKHTLCYRCYVAEQEKNSTKAISLISRAQRLARSTDWRSAGEEFKTLQQEWKSVNPLPKEDSDKLWEQFNSACQSFFTAREKHFGEQDRVRQSNKARALSLISQAQRLARSTDWRSAGEEFKTLQQEWKSVNPLPKEDSDKLWEQFNSACQSFFTAREWAYNERQNDFLRSLENNIQKAESAKANIIESIVHDEGLISDWQDKIYNLKSGGRAEEIRYALQQKIDAVSEKIHSKRNKVSDITQSIMDMRQKL